MSKKKKLKTKKVGKKNKKKPVAKAKARKKIAVRRPKPQATRIEKPESEGIKKVKIRVIGIGGGGGTIVSEIASKMKKASFVVANTDVQALKSAGKKVSHFQFGQSLTRGLGTGMNAELGREAAQNEKERIKRLLEGQDLCILVACLGGGAGSGALPIFAKISKDLGNLTYGILTLPFKFEGDKKMEIAKESLKQVKNYLNAITLIPNERVFQVIDKATPLKQALSIVNKILADSLGSLIETIYEPGMINIDYADFKTVMEGKGRLAYLNTVEVQRKDDSIKDLMDRILNSPLYPYNIKGAKGVLFNISGEKKLSLEEVNQISKSIADLVSSEAKIIFGISQSSKYSNSIRTTLFATGCGTKFFSISPAKIVKKIKKRIVKKQEVKKKKTKRRIVEKAAPKKEKTETKKTKKKAKMVKKVKIRVVKEKVTPQENISEEKVRKSGLQLKKETEAELEKELMEKERFWEMPAFLREKTDEK